MTLSDALSGDWAGFAAEEAVPLLQAEVARLQFAYDTLDVRFSERNQALRAALAKAEARVRELEMENAELVTQRDTLTDNFKRYAEEHGPR